MNRFTTIASIRIEHDYYDPPVNRFVDLTPTSEAQKLMKQRGVLFRKTDVNEWQWIKSDDVPGFANEDKAEVSVRVNDPHFLLKIESKGYIPGSCYKLKLENEDVEINAGYIWKKEAVGRKPGNEFCRIVLLPEVCNRKFTVRFCPGAYYWEYLCVFKDEKDLRGKDLSLRTLKNRIAFSPPEQYEKSNLGTNEWRIVSTTRINAKERYDIPLHLYIGNQIESRFVSPPQIGKFQSDIPYFIREICYINKQ